MCLKTALKASGLCMLPSLIGFSAGLLSVEYPRVFLAALVLSLAGAATFALRSYGKPSTSSGGDVADVEVAAGVLLALSFIFGFWVGLAAIAGHGIVSAGVIVAVGTALLAATTLTFVKRVVERKVPWLEYLVQRFLPELDPPRYGRV